MLKDRPSSVLGSVARKRGEGRVGPSFVRRITTLFLGDRQGRESWSYSFSAEDWSLQGIYYNSGADCINFSILFQQAMNEALREFEYELPRITQALGHPPSPEHAP